MTKFNGHDDTNVNKGYDENGKFVGSTRNQENYGFIYNNMNQNAIDHVSMIGADDDMNDMKIEEEELQLKLRLLALEKLKKNKKNKKNIDSNTISTENNSNSKLKNI